MNSKKISMTDYIQKDFYERFLWKFLNVFKKISSKRFLRQISMTDFFEKFLKIVKKISMKNYIQKDFYDRFLWKISKCVQKDFFKKFLNEFI